MPNRASARPTLLKELKARFGGKLSQCTAYDGNVCSTQSLPDKPWVLKVVAGRPFTSELKLKYRNRRIVLVTNNTDSRIEIRGDTASRILTINREERAGGFRSKYVQSQRIGSREYPAYTENGELTLTQESILNSASLAKLLDTLRLEENESVHFNNSAIDIYLKTPSFPRTLSAIEQGIDLIEQIEITPEQLDLHGLPEEFHSLRPFIKKWAVGDDRDREELLENSATKILSKLVQTVEPYLERIDSYLDSFPNGKPSEAAAALGRLAECVLEAKQRLAEST